MAYDAVIVGAGPSGLSTAWSLAACGWQVLIIEKASLPRDKVCGGFVGPENKDFFARIGILDPLLAAGARKVTQVVLTSNNGARIQIPVLLNGRPDFGLALSRKCMDAIFAESVRNTGVELRSNSIIESVERATDFQELSVKNWKTGRQETLETRTLVYAYGAAERKTEKSDGFFGIYALFDGVADMDSTVYLHLIENGHIGVNQFENGQTNLCYVADRRLYAAAGGNLEKLFSKFLDSNPSFKKQMEQARQITRWKGTFIKKEPPPALFEEGRFYVGDAAGVVHPIIGGGISIAIANGLLLGAILGRQNPKCFSLEESARLYGAAWKSTFDMRIKTSRFWGYLSHRKAVANLAFSLVSARIGFMKRLFHFYHHPIQEQKIFFAGVSGHEYQNN